eukprot:Amastigsp_a342605_14.p3 type:complete len:143 gc:universal Amastigsp_a342605_14:460-32(-)
MRAVGDFEATVRRDAAFLDRVELLEKLRNMEHHSVAENIHRVRIHDAAREQMERVLFAVRDDRVARVGAAVEACNNIVLGGEDIGEFAFALVAPLRTKNSSHARRRTTIKPGCSGNSRVRRRCDRRCARSNATRSHSGRREH